MSHHASNEARHFTYGYEPPVSDLLVLGERPLQRRKPLDYHAMGIGQQHLADLARMSWDPALNYEHCGDSPEGYASIHAMRAMVQIGTQATVAPLVRLLEYDDTVDCDEICDWFLEEIPEALAAIGAPAIPRVAELLRDRSKHIYSRAAAASALTQITQQHPEARPECLQLLAGQLELFADNDPEWNGWLVADLSSIKANETAPLIERAFAANRVDETIVGDWDEVQAALGLRPPLSPEEYAEKCLKRQAAHGWQETEDFDDDEVDEDLVEELAADWDDSGDEAWDRFATRTQVDAPLETDKSFRMAMPDETYTAQQRRRIAQERNKERKAADRAKARRRQNKKQR